MYGGAIETREKRSWWGQVDDILKMGTLSNKTFFKVSSK